MIVAMGTQSFSVNSESDAYSIAQYCRSIALSLGISEFHANLFNAAVSEIAINAVRYAKTTQAHVGQTSNSLGVEVTIEDRGSGIKNLKDAMQDGYSTFEGKSLGLGLGVAQRCADEMIVNRSDASGTSITLRQYLPVSEADISVRIISHPALGFSDNNDIHFIKQFNGDTYLVMLLELGRQAKLGGLIHDYAQGCMRAVKENYRESLVDIVKKCAQSSLVSLANNPLPKLTLLRVGRESIEIASSKKSPVKWLVESRDEGIKQTKRPIKEQFIVCEYSKTVRPEYFTLFMYSQGIDIEKFDIEPDTVGDAPYEIASKIFNCCELANYDATVIVVKGGQGE